MATLATRTFFPIYFLTTGFVLEQLSFSALKPMAVLAVIRLKAQVLPWTELMDAAMVAVHSQQGRTAADIKAACVRAPMDHRMHEVCPVMHIHTVFCAASSAA